MSLIILRIFIAKSWCIISMEGQKAMRHSGCHTVPRIVEDEVCFPSVMRKVTGWSQTLGGPKDPAGHKRGFG